MTGDIKIIMAQAQNALALFLIIIGFVTFIGSLPLVIGGIDTGNGSAFENNSALLKNVIGSYPVFVAAFGIIILIAGIKMAVG